ncbi:MAG: ribosome small subunit-dependent GTPase A [Bacteroidetes bacterium RIFCSPLOWO2_12_FULL_31_6]|nr:MAG: ribosome small subunit-dependent GTPase A [Bacteroidetes bacterium RIFCSPLOWO2_12_FULL_31_6]
MKGIVIKSTGSWYSVRIDNGEQIEARIKGKFRLKGIRTTNPIAVGDNVIFTQEEDGTAVINKIEERKNYIIRKSINLSKRSHIIAANIDQAILVVTLIEPKTYTAFIDRFLVTAEAYHIPAVIVFNKIDIYSDKEKEQLAFLKKAYEKIGYSCLEVSATKNVNMGLLTAIMKDKASMISGHSGVGKTTLLNVIEPNLNLKTSAISTLHKAGKHTTTFAEMFELSFGGFIIDTPGIKAFGLIDFDKEELSHYFLEMRKRLTDCQFSNCIHINEPHCAVKEAVENGEIAEFRYLNYLSMYNDDEEENYRAKGY